MKFGGSLLNNEIKFKNIINIIKSYHDSNNEIIVIISAIDGITDKIIDICNQIKKVNENSISLFLKNIEIIHTNLIEKIIVEQKSNYCKQFMNY